MRKKGQITIYVVAGIIVIGLLLLVITFRDAILVSEWEKERQAAQIIPENVKVVQDFVLDCVEKVGDDAVNIMGLQGGYIDVPVDIYPSTPTNPLSNALKIFPTQEYKTAFWFYETANKIQRKNIPEIKNMEEELAKYMEDNLASCTLNFTLFEEFNITSGPIDAKAEIRDKRILYTVSYPITIEIEDFRFNFPKFYQEVNVPLGELYEKAKELLNNIEKDYYLEEFTIDILAVNEDIPFSGTEMSCTPKFWNVPEVTQELKTQLERNVPHIKVKGTSFGEKNEYFVWDILDGFNSDLHVDFRYSPSWPIKLEVHPSDAGVLTAEPFNDPSVEEMAYVSSYLCLLDYNFIYDIIYPVLIALYDEDGYVFQFATQVIIDNNQPRLNVLGEDDYPEEQPRICKEPVTLVNVFALDGESFVTIADATIKIKCVSTVCELGKTDFNEITGTSYLAVRSPACVNALLTAEKEGYHRGRTLVDTTEASDLSVIMDKFRSLDYEIKIVEQSGYVRDATASEIVIITLNEEEKRYTTTLTSDRAEEKVKLIPGLYQFRAQVAAESEEGFYIEGKTVDNCVETPEGGFLGTFLGLREEHCYTAEVPGVTLDQVMIGGANFEWTVSGGELDSASKIIFYVPVKPAPKTQEDVVKVYEDIDASTVILYPEMVP